MSSGGRWKLLGVLLVASTLLGVVGWQQLLPQTRLPTTVTITPWTTTASATQTTVAPQRQTEWIRIGEVKPVDYYLSLLESNRTAPYGQLFWELRELPELTNATAVAKITYLALNASNPEVKEAFELMIRGGTPDPKDYNYQVPNCNTELQVLYWLACQNEFKRDDTLALSIAMVHGLWVTMGDDQVREAVKKNASVILAFFRETDGLQRKRGYYQLESYPLEAKLALAWTGSLSMHWMGPRSQLKYPASLVYWKQQRLPLIVYEKNTVSVETLTKMREEADTRRWWQKEVNRSVGDVEEFFYFSPRYWEDATFPAIVDDKGLDATLDVDWQFNRYLNGKPPQGDCGTETAWVDAWAKAIGIATVLTWKYRLDVPSDSSSYRAHHHAIYFDPRQLLWTAYEKQISILGPLGTSDETWPIRYFIFRPPIDQGGYTEYDVSESNHGLDMCYAKAAFCVKAIRLGETVAMMTRGVDTAQMKQWLLYS